jgi:hypothetical protein
MERNTADFYLELLVGYAGVGPGARGNWRPPLKVASGSLIRAIIMDVLIYPHLLFWYLTAIYQQALNWVGLGLAGTSGVSLDCLWPGTR